MLLLLILLVCLVQKKNTFNISASFVKKFTNSKKLFRKPHKIFWSGFPLLSLVNFSNVHSWSTFRQFSGSQAVFGTTFRVTVKQKMLKEKKRFDQFEPNFKDADTAKWSEQKTETNLLLQHILILDLWNLADIL
jgi:hypothetical protein